MPHALYFTYLACTVRKVIAMGWIRGKTVVSMKRGLAVILALMLSAMMFPIAALTSPAYAELAPGGVPLLEDVPGNTPEGAQPLDLTMHVGLDADASSEAVTALTIGQDYTLVLETELGISLDKPGEPLMWVKTDSFGNFLEDPLDGIEEKGYRTSGNGHASNFKRFGIRDRSLSAEDTTTMPVGTYRLFYYASVYDSETRTTTLATYYSRQHFTVSSARDEQVSVAATDAGGAAVAAFADLSENHTWDSGSRDDGIPKYTLEVPAEQLTGAYLEAVDLAGNPLSTQYTHLPDIQSFDTGVSGTTKVPILEFNEFGYTAIYPVESGESWGSRQEYRPMPSGTYRFCFYDAAGTRYLSRVFAFGEGVSVIGQASEPLVVNIPQSITGKATLPSSARLVTAKGGAEATFWSGTIKETITNYAFPEGTYDGAKLQVILNGEYTTIAKYDGSVSRGATITLSEAGCADFWHVPRVEVLNGSGAVVPSTEYKMSITGEDGKTWSVPGFMAAQEYTATLKMSGSTNVYTFSGYNAGAGKKFTVNREGVFSVGALDVKAPSANVGVTVSDPEGNPLEGVRVSASQTLVNGCAYNVGALTDSSGACSFTLWDADSVSSGTQTTYTLSYGSYLRWESGAFADSNSVQVNTQATGATLNLSMAQRRPSRVDLSWTMRYERTDAVTVAYASDLPCTFTLEGSIDGAKLANTFAEGPSYLNRYFSPDQQSAGYDLWSDADIGLLVNGNKTLELEMKSETFHMGADTMTVQLDEDNCAQASFELVPRAGVRANLRAALNKAMGPCVAWWFDASGTFIGASDQVAMVDGSGRWSSFVAPRNESGTYTVAFAPQSAVEPVKLADITDADIPKKTVDLVADKGADLGTVELAAASAGNARYVLQPNSNVSAPERWVDDSDLIAVSAHLEADADAENATISHLEFIANEGAETYWGRTFTASYVTGDFDGDGQIERKNLGGENVAESHHVDQAFLKFDEPVKLPLDVTVYGRPFGDVDIKLTVVADVAYTKDGESKTSRDDVVGTAEIAKPGATITAPSRTASETISVSGVTRNAYSKVRIYDSGTLVGTATSGQRGTWTADVKLSGCSDSRATMHMVYATSGNSTTDAVDVTHNARAAALKRSGMYFDGRYRDVNETYIWLPRWSYMGRNATFEAEIANPGSLKPTSAIVAETASMTADDLLAQPVVFGVEFLNGDVCYYKGTQVAPNSGIFQSEPITIYSPVVSIAVFYENDESKESFNVKDADGYDTVEVSSADFLADLTAEPQSIEDETYEDVLAGLNERGADFTWATDELGENAGKLSAPRLTEMHRAQKAAKRSDVSFTLSGLETASAFEEDLAYAKARAAAAPDTARLTTGTVGANDNAGGYYKVYTFSEDRDANADGELDTSFAMQLVETHDQSAIPEDVTYAAFTSFESSVNAPLPGLEGLSTLETQSAAGTTSTAGTLTAQGWPPRSLYCSNDDIERSKAFTGALRDGDLNQALYTYCVNEIPELETYLRNRDWQNATDSLWKDLDNSRFTPCFSKLSSVEKDRQREYVNEFYNISWKYKSRMNNKAKLSIGWGLGCRVLTKAGTTKELSGVAGRFNSDTAKKLGDGVKAAGDAASKTSSTSIDADYANLMQQYKLYKFRIKRVETNAGLKSGDHDCTDLPKNKIAAVNKSHPNIDPSGYLYEAVASNRVEDATVTLYENVNGAKTLVESESDVIAGEKNPLVTDGRGHYEWFVPTGLWLVEADKAGYEHADSQNLPNIPESDKETKNGTNWLKVPPPQTEVNIGMECNESPYLKSIYAASDGVHLEFSRYMDESTLTRENFSLKSEDGADVAFTPELLDSEAAPHAASTSYASKVLLRAPLSDTSCVKVAVAADVASYAGAKMGTAYTSVLDVVRTYTLNVEGGTVDGATSVALPEGAQVQVTANGTQAGVSFAGWSASAGVLGDAAQAVTDFTMPASNATVKAAFTGTARGKRDAAYDNASTSGDPGGEEPAPNEPVDDKPVPDVPKPSGTATVPTMGKLTLSNLAKGVQVTWRTGAASSVSGYEVWRSKGSGAWKLVATVSKASTGKYTDKKATAKGARYRYRIRAYQMASGAAAYGEYSAIGTTYRVNKAAVKSLAPGNGRLTVKMAKKASAYGAKGFQVAYRVKGAGKWRYVTSSAQKRIVKKLVRGKRYQVKARAFKKVGKVKYYGAWSAAKVSKKVK